MQYSDALEIIRDTKASLQFCIDEIIPVDHKLGCGADKVIDALTQAMDVCVKCESMLEDAKAEDDWRWSHEPDGDSDYEAWKDRRAEEE